MQRNRKGSSAANKIALMEEEERLVSSDFMNVIFQTNYSSVNFDCSLQFCDVDSYC